MGGVVGELALEPVTARWAFSAEHAVLFTPSVSERELWSGYAGS